MGGCELQDTAQRQALPKGKRHRDNSLPSNCTSKECLESDKYQESETEVNGYFTKNN